ncbi:MAG TPA: hypothetical protein VFJ98_08700 [Mycobacteriales bacterium]|nr:hypothetical protein [Mycobacteriales bacterium]
MSRTLSPYDAGVPHPAPDDALAARFAALREVRPAVSLDAVRDVVLLVSSSRGGSSMLTEILRRVDGVLTLPGEVNPHVVVAQLTAVDGDVFLAELARDVGRPADGIPATDELAADVHWRLTAQWPRSPLAAVDVRRWVEAAAAVADPRDTNAFTVAVLDRVAQAAPEVTAAPYDLDGARGDPPPPCAPVVEMTPYVGFRSWRRPTADELAHSPLVIASPRNSYRLAWLGSLFPHARVRLLHLTRNPAASVNGLLDGWTSAAFFTTPVDVDLAITGYSDRIAAGRRWWKYDVPPHWRELTAASLPQVAAAQWQSAHAAVLDHIASTGIETLRVRYEDLVGDPVARERTAAELAGFLGVDPARMRAAVVDGVPPVMATAPPQRRRWSASVHDLAPALGEPSLWETAAALGYGVEERLWI